MELPKSTCKTILYKKQFKDPEIYEEIVRELQMNPDEKESILVEISVEKS